MNLKIGEETVRSRKLKIISIVLALLVVLMPGCSVSGRDGGNTNELNMAIANYPPTMDPQLVSDTLSSQMTAIYCGRLYRYNNEGELVPDLAESYEVSEDGLSWTFHISPDAKWSNGDPVTADDFVFAVQRVADPETGSGAIYVLTDYCNIKNVDEAYAGEVDVSEIGAVAVDDSTLRFDLASVCPYFLSLVSLVTFAPCNREFFYSCNGHYCDSVDTMISSGAFAIDRYEPLATQVHFTKNSGYAHSEDVALDGINCFTIANAQQSYMCFDIGQLDITQLSGDVLDMVGDDDRVHVVRGGIYYMFFNFISDAVNNQNIRNALIRSLDREAIADSVIKSGSEPETRLVMEGMYQGESSADYDEQTEDFDNLCGFDPEAARELWEEGLSEIGESSVTLTVAYRNAMSTYVEAMAEQWEDNLPGLTIQFEPLQPEQWVQELSGGDYDLMFSGWVPDYADPTAILSVMVTNTNATSPLYSDPHYDELLDQADSAEFANAPEARNEILHEAEMYVAEQAAYIPIVFNNYDFIVSDRVSGFAGTPVGMQLIVQDMSLEEES